MQQWRPVVGYEGRYEVSDSGDVVSLLCGRRGRRGIHNRNGYLGTVLFGPRKWFGVHRLVAEAFIPNPDGKPTVNHINGIKDDNRVENLEWATHSEQAYHAAQTGLIKYRRGSEHHGSKSSEQQVRAIRAFKALGATYDQIAALVGLSRGTIAQIVTGKTWRHVA